MNLKNLYGDRFQIKTEDGTDRRDSTNQVIPCRQGHIYRHSETQLGAATKTFGRAAKALLALPCVTVRQDGSDGINVIFDPADFDAVAQVMEPRPKRTVTDKQRAQLAANRLKSAATRRVQAPELVGSA
jgi:hypothetical protein